MPVGIEVKSKIVHVETQNMSQFPKKKVTIKTWLRYAWFNAWWVGYTRHSSA